MSAQWQMFLAYSAALHAAAGDSPVTAGVLDLAANVNLDMVHNRPGSAKLVLPLEDHTTRLVVPQQTCILAVRDDIVRWSGPVKTVDHDLDANETTVAAEGWLSVLDGRKLRAILVRAAETDPVRVAALLAAIAAQVDSLGRTIGLPITYGGHVGETRMVGATTYERGLVLGSLINGLIEIENGFDVVINPTTKIMTTHRSLIKGGIRGYGVDRPGVLYSYGVGNDNLSKLRQSIDGNIANIINALGPSTARPQTTDDPDSIVTYGAWEEDFSMTDQGINEQELQFGAAAEVSYRKDPQVLYTATPFPWTEDSNVPRLFEDYNLGDIGRLAGRRGWLTIPPGLESGQTQPVRFYGAKITVGVNGDETIDSLQFSPS